MSFSKEANTQYVDLLDEDKPLSGQKFACISFISPEKVLKQKNLFLFEEFIKQWDFTKSFEKFQQFLNFLSFKYNLDVNDIMNDVQSFMKEESSILKISTMMKTTMMKKKTTMKKMMTEMRKVEVLD